MNAQKLSSAFNDFATRGNPTLAMALDKAMQFCLDMAGVSVPPYWLTLLGPSGVGKTMLARKITSFFHARLDGFRDEAKAGNWLRHGGMKAWGAVINDAMEGDYSGLRNLKEDWFVCLDDIGAEYDRHKDLSVAKLYDVLSARTNRFTVITANLTQDDVNRKMDARIASRLLRHGSVVVDIDAPDFNL